MDQLLKLLFICPYLLYKEGTRKEINTQVLETAIRRSFNDRCTKSIIRASDTVYVVCHSFPRDSTQRVIGIMKKLGAREVVSSGKERGERFRANFIARAIRRDDEGQGGRTRAQCRPVRQRRITDDERGVGGRKVRKCIEATPELARNKEDTEW